MKTIFILMMFGLTGVAWGTTYYVSSSLGNDANNGTSTATPWRTIGNVNGQTFQPGDSILLRRGDVWNESLVPPSSGASGNPISFDAYGTGAPPNLTGYYAVPASAWVNVTGNAWKAQLTPVTGTYAAINFCLFGSVWGQKVPASSSNLTAQWDFYLANGYLYVYSVGNPGTNPSLLPIVPMALSDVPVININGKTWLSFQHILVNWFDDYGVYVQGASDHLVFANMEVDSLIPEGTQPLGFYVDESAPGPGDIKIYNAEAHLNYDGFRFDGAATAITMVNDKGYANRDGALVDNTGAVTYSYCHFYASSLAVAGSTDVEWTSGNGPTAGTGNVAADTPPAVQVWQRYPARVTLTVDDSGMTPGADTYYAGTVLPVADAAGVPVGAAITVGYPLAQTLISEFQGWINAGRDVTSHSMSHTYYTNTDALDIQYTGSGTAATLSISNKVLTITATGDSSSPWTFNLAQGQPQGTIGGLNTALVNTGKFTTSYLTPCQGPYGTGCSAYTFAALLSQDLANVSGIDVKTSEYHMLLNVTSLTTDEITLSRLWMTENLTGLPATPVYVYPGGYENPNLEAITAGTPYAGARGALHEGGTANSGQPVAGANDTYASGFNVQDITSFGVNPSWMGSAGVTPALLNQKIKALVWKEQVWGVPWGIFWHLNELVQNDPVGGTEITNLIQDFKSSGATILTNTGLVNWLTTGTLETGTDGNYYYKSPALSAYAANGGLDFRPTAGSPVVDKGETLGTAYQIDLNGLNQNDYGTRWEIGAHAYAAYSSYGPPSPPANSRSTIGAAQAGMISSANFGMQCGIGATNCPDQSGTEVPTWPATVAQPGVLRLWDSQASWSYLMTAYSGGVGTYNWAQLDGYLDDIAAHQPLTVNYVFGCVPAFATSGPSGTTPGSCGSNGSATPPNDLTSGGSPTFTQFVTDLMNHCSPAGHCVSTYIGGFELWNEANVSSGAGVRWTGTQTQLYQMLAPAVAVIRGKLPGARIFTPSITSGGGSWMTGWVGAEIAGGIISNYYNIHEYLNNNTPESVLSSTSGSLAPNTGTSGWSALPWVMTETGYDNVTPPYSCNAGNTGTLFSTNDCVGQMVRWNILLFANGGSGLYWYYWNTYIGSVPQYAAAYYYMMQYMAGGRFTAAASSTTNGSIQTWTAPFTEGNGTTALWAWTTSEAGTNFAVPTGYGDYRDLNGNTTAISVGDSIAITTEPILLEQAGCGPPSYPCSRSDLATVAVEAVPPQMGPNSCTAGNLQSCGNLTGAGTCVNDPDFHNPVCRLTQAGFDPAHPNFAMVTTGSGSGDENLWNCNDTMMTVDDTGGRSFPVNFTGTSISAMYASNPTYSGFGGFFYTTAGFWGHNCSNPPAVLYNLGNGQSGTASGMGTQLGHWDFTNQTMVPTFTLDFDFSSSANCLGSGFTTTWTTNGGSDQTDTDYGFGFSNNGGQGAAGAIYVAVWRRGSGCRVLNLSTQTVTGDWGPTGAVTGGGGCAGGLLHNVKLFKAGGANGAIIVDYAAPCGSPSQAAYVWQYNGLNFGALCTSECSGHWTEGLTTWANNAGNNVPNYWEVRPYAAPGSPTGITPADPTAGYPPNTDWHAGWNTLNDANPFLASTYTTKGQAITSGWQNEVIGVSPSGTASPWRFAHTFNTGINANFSVEIAVGSESQTGKYFAFTSDWENTLGSTNGTAACIPNGPTWQASTIYGPTNILVINPATANNAGGYSYQATTVGTSGTTTPATFNQTVGGTTTDGTVTWTNLGGPPNCRGDVFVVTLQ